MKTEVHKFISSANEAVRIMTKHEMMAEVACIVLAHTPQGRCFTGNKGTSKGEILKCGRRKVNSSLLIGEPKAFSLPLSLSLSFSFSVSAAIMIILGRDTRYSSPCRLAAF